MTSKLRMLTLVGVLAAGTALADPPSWAPAHGYRDKQQENYREQQEHHYVYYRDYDTPIYYSPEQQLWFWFNGGNWQFGVNLPTTYQAYVGSGGVSITLDSSRPYEREDYVIQHYGAPHGRHGHRGHPQHHDDDD
ncbi:MAG: hypothetical protein KGJ55_09145 [Gammaproteobacteria bacterium]|nr:hypothetical protein [Gammaproteobacteria bacterium]